MMVHWCFSSLDSNKKVLVMVNIYWSLCSSSRYSDCLFQFTVEPFIVCRQQQDYESWLPLVPDPNCPSFGRERQFWGPFGVKLNILYILQCKKLLLIVRCRKLEKFLKNISHTRTAEKPSASYLLLLEMTGRKQCTSKQS